MSRDNVTPFRRPPPRPTRPQQQGGMGFRTHRGKAVLVHVLTIFCFAAPYLLGGGQIVRFVYLGMGVAAGVIAYTSRPEAMPWAATHHEQALRTLLIAFAATTLLSLPGFVISRDAMSALSWYLPIYFWGNVIVALWAGVRAIVGLALAAMRRPTFNPRGWLV